MIVGDFLIVWKWIGGFSLGILVFCLKGVLVFFGSGISIGLLWGGIGRDVFILGLEPVFGA